MTNILIVVIDDLDEIVYKLENDTNYPTIDTDAILSLMIEMFLNNRHMSIDTAASYIMQGDILSDRISSNDEYYMKLESIIYKLLLSIQIKLKKLSLDNDPPNYSYMCKRRNNIVLLKKDNNIYST